MQILQDTLLVFPLKMKRKSLVHSYLFLELLQWAVELGSRSENRLPTSMIISHNPALKKAASRMIAGRHSLRLKATRS